ncbi:MAG: HAMP domain-containing sensor histidine kinase, partial [Chloroflexota bacterium]
LFTPLLIIFGFGFIFINALSTKPPHHEMMYLAIMILFTGNLFRPWVTLLTAGMTLVTLAIFSIFAPSMTSHLQADLRIFFMVITVFTFFITYHRNQLERDRQNIILQEQTRLKLLLANLPIIMWTMNENLKIENFSGKGYASLEENQLRQALVSHLQQHVNVIDSSSETARFEFELDSLTFEAIIQKLAHSSQTEYIGVAIDITERKQNETFLRQQVRQEEQRRILNDFLSNASHDLRTPLTILRTSSYLLERLTDPESRQKQIDKLNRTIDHLDNTTDSMFRLLRLNMKAIPILLPAQINTIVENVITKHLTTIDHKQIRIERDFDGTLPKISVAEEELMLGLSEILKNALQYSDHDSTVSIQTAQDESHIIIKVQDEGVGIPEEHFSDIFQPFYRVTEHRSTEEQQIGMGLAIAQRIVERHGGTIDVESTLGVGTTFTIRIPLREQ